MTGFRRFIRFAGLSLGGALAALLISVGASAAYELIRAWPALPVAIGLLLAGLVVTYLVLHHKFA